MAARDTFNKLDETKKARILDAAVEEFSRHGFRQASVNRMVDSIGIAKGSLFQYFGSKEGLFTVIFNYAVELVRQSLRQVKKQTCDEDFFERIKESLLAGIRFIERHPRVYRIYLKMIFQEDFPLRAEFLQQVHLFSAEYLRPVVEAGIERGDLRADTDIEMTLFMLDALMDRFLQAYCVPFLDAGASIYQAPAGELERKVDEFIKLLRYGMGAPQGARSEGREYVRATVL
ncbi:MAG: TetR/AcrR family transcriptional regulator [Deltaproteobacteria bacterium]|jgi:AcrR family transcriptional regulator|nr:TetR/AcrR family transcriptional regulator [Deltaproteobacteria bacterium]